MSLSGENRKIRKKGGSAYLCFYNCVHDAWCKLTNWLINLGKGRVN